MTKNITFQQLHWRNLTRSVTLRDIYTNLAANATPINSYIIRTLCDGDFAVTIVLNMIKSRPMSDCN